MTRATVRLTHSRIYFTHTHSGTRCVALGRTGTGTTERDLAIVRPLTTVKSLLKSENGS